MDKLQRMKQFILNFRALGRLTIESHPHMAIISTELLEEDMELLSPVKTQQGQVLFGIGHKLKTKHIDMMLAWGITEADIKVREDSESAKRYQESIQREEKSLMPRFQRCDMADPVVRDVLRFVAELRVEKTLGGQP
jgi:hypothetical protein